MLSRSEKIPNAATYTIESAASTEIDSGYSSAGNCQVQTVAAVASDCATRSYDPEFTQ
jgi:hypothetical protein